MDFGLCTRLFEYVTDTYSCARLMHYQGCRLHEYVDDCLCIYYLKVTARGILPRRGLFAYLQLRFHRGMPSTGACQLPCAAQGKQQYVTAAGTTRKSILVIVVRGRVARPERAGVRARVSGGTRPPVGRSSLGRGSASAHASAAAGAHARVKSGPRGRRAWGSRLGAPRGTELFFIFASGTSLLWHSSVAALKIASLPTLVPH